MAQKIPYLNNWRTFSDVRGSFGPSLAEIKGSQSIISRYEWIIYKEVIIETFPNGSPMICPPPTPEIPKYWTDRLDVKKERAGSPGEDCAGPESRPFRVDWLFLVQIR